MIPDVSITASSGRRPASGMGPSPSDVRRPTSDVAQERKLRALTRDLEAVFWQQLLARMRATVPEGGLAVGRDEKFMQGLFDEALAGQLAQRGGLGLAEALYRQLSGPGSGIGETGSHSRVNVTGERNPDFPHPSSYRCCPQPYGSSRRLRLGLILHPSHEVVPPPPPPVPALPISGSPLPPPVPGSRLPVVGPRPLLPDRGGP